MITLKFKNYSDLDNKLWEEYERTTANPMVSPTSIVLWIKNLDYVYDFRFSRGETIQNTLYFETEQDKIFFLLKYS